MQSNTNIVSLLTQSFSQPAGGNPASLTDSIGRADFDQVLGKEFDRPVYEKELAPYEKEFARRESSNDRVETPVRSDRPEPRETPHPEQSEQARPFEDAPAGRSEKPVHDESENPQASAAANASPAAESQGNESENPQASVAANASPAAESRGAEQGQTPVDEIPNHLNASQQALKDRLEQLNIDPEIIDTLLESLVGNPQANGLVQSLYGLLNAAGATQTGAGALSIAGEAQAGLPENLVLQNLIRAGLSEAEARQLIEQAAAALASKQIDSKNGPLLATLPQADGLKGNGTETSSEKLPSKSVTQNLPLTQNNAETRPDSDSKNSSNANGDKFEKLASLLRTDANTSPAAQTNSPFKLAANPLLNLNGQTAAPLNVPGADGLALQAATAVNNAGKSAEVFKPVLAETYGQRGSVEKTVASQIIERISFRGMGSHKEINIKLDPPSLGSVRMNVSTTGESVRTTIVTENHFVKQVIESQLPQLRDSLANQGIKVDHFSVLVGGNSEQNTAHQQESASPTSYLGLENEDLQDTVEELVLTRGPVIFNDSTINVFA